MCVARSLLITEIPVVPSGIPVYSPHSTSLTNILSASSHSHLLYFDEADLEKSGRKIFTPTVFIICHMIDSCTGVALECPGPSLNGKKGSWSEGENSGSTLNWTSSKGSLVFHKSWSTELAGRGSASLFSVPRRVSTWNRRRAYILQNIDVTAVKIIFGMKFSNELNSLQCALHMYCLDLCCHHHGHWPISWPNWTEFDSRFQVLPLYLEFLVASFSAI